MSYENSSLINVFSKRYSTRIRQRALHINMHEISAIRYALRL